MHKLVIIFLGLYAILLLLGSSNMNISKANAITEFDNKDKKQVSVSSLECNNINVDANGLELDVFAPFLANSGLAAEAVEGNTDTSSIVGNNGDGSQINDFRVICIQNNNNIVTEAEEEPTPPTPPSTNLDLAVASFTLDNPVSIRLGNGNGTFISAPDVQAGVNPISITVGDFNSDSNQDLAVASFAFGNIVAIRLGNGNGTFTSAPDVPVGNQPTSVIVGFFNTDANLDLAVSNNVDNDVSIRLGLGDGNFTSAPDVVVGDDPLSVTAGFLNADSNLDLAVPSQIDGNVSIRLGFGDGTFTTPTTSPPDVPVGDAPAEVALGLFNADSNLDMAVVVTNEGKVAIRLGNGNGTFTSAPDVSVGDRPVAIVLDLFNADSNLDMAVVDLANGVVSIRLGIGDGTFTTPTTSPPDVQVGLIPVSIAVGDINADSNLDLVVANQNDNDLSIRLGIGDGTFTTPTTSPPDVIVKDLPQSVAVGNFDNN
jgi:hypothetical protein